MRALYLSKRIAPSLAILLLSLGLRLYGIQERDFWSDEFFYHGRDFRETVRAALHPQDNGGHLPLFYIMRCLVVEISGDGRLPMRILPAIQGAAGSLLVAMAAFLVFERREAFFMAGLLAAVNPFWIYYSQESNIYSGTAFFSALILLAVLKGVRSGAWKGGVKALYLIAITAGLFNDFFFLFNFAGTFIAFSLYLLFRQRGFLKGWILMNLLPAALFSAYALLVAGTSSGVVETITEAHTDPLAISGALNLPIPFSSTVARVFTEGIPSLYPFFTPSWVDIPIISALLMALTLTRGIKGRRTSLLLILSFMAAGFLLVMGASLLLYLLKVGHFMDARKVIWLLPHFMVGVTGAFLTFRSMAGKALFFIPYLAIPSLTTFLHLDNIDDSVSRMLSFMERRYQEGDYFFGTDFIPTQNFYGFPFITPSRTLRGDEKSIPAGVKRLWVFCPRTSDFEIPLPDGAPLYRAVEEEFFDAGEWIFSSPFTIRHMQETLLRLKLRRGKWEEGQRGMAKGVIDTGRIPLYRGPLRVFLNKASAGEWGDSSGDRCIHSFSMKSGEVKEMELPPLSEEGVYYLGVAPVTFIDDQGYHPFRRFFTRSMGESRRFSKRSMTEGGAITLVPGPLSDPFIHALRGVIILYLSALSLLAIFLGIFRR